MSYYIFDLDGTVCNSAHREHFARARMWDEFHERLLEDKPWPEIALLVKALSMSFHSCIALSGRNDKYRPQTIQWLAKHDLEFDKVILRPNNNFESDAVLKPKLLAEHFGGMENALNWVSIIFDDREKVVESWRNLGFTCYQPRPGGY